MTTIDPSPATAVLLIAHGSRRREANDDARALAARLAAAGPFPIVRAAFLELADPDIPGGAAACLEAGALRVLMVPYFLAEGVHIRRDLTAARDALGHRFPHAEFRLGPPLGPHPLLDQLVAERIRQTDLTGEAASPASGR